MKDSSFDSAEEKIQEFQDFDKFSGQNLKKLLSSSMNSEKKSKKISRNSNTNLPSTARTMSSFMTASKTNSGSVYNLATKESAQKPKVRSSKLIMNIVKSVHPGFEKSKVTVPKKVSKFQKIYLQTERTPRVKEDVSETPEYHSLTERNVRRKKETSKTIPKITTKIAMNNLLIKDSRMLANSKDGIARTTYHQQIYDDFALRKKEKIKEKIKFNSKKFERLKSLVPIDEIETELSNDRYNLLHTDHERAYNEAKMSYRKSRHLKVKSQARILSKLISNMKRGENIEELGEVQKNEKIILRKNLQNSIYLAQILKKKNLSEDEEMGLFSLNDLKRHVKQSNVEFNKVLKGFSVPRFLKTSFNKNTNQQCRALEGKFFGLPC